MTGHDRFDYRTNVARASSYRGRRSPYWPPADQYALFCLDLANAAPDLDDDFFGALATLRDAVEAEWQRAKERGIPARTRFHEPQPVAAALRRLGASLPDGPDRRAVLLRAEAIESGYEEDTLAALAGLEEDVAIVAGQIATWYGKQTGGLPTAFACRRDKARQADVGRALDGLEDVPPYLAGLHADLRLGKLPAFAATEVFFMAGEGNLHPKHIAYFLPEDEGVKRSPFKKTYYFSNTHRALLASISAPLAARYLDVGVSFDPADGRFSAIPTLGVLAHELGHFVHRPATRYAALNAADRWASVTLQEIAADVFGTLILAEVWAGRLGLAPADVIAYYLAECLRYTDRGLGCFPDCDGMFLQLSYFVRLGALALETGPEPRLAGDPEVVLAGLRSLARVLADTLLAERADPSVVIYRTFGPDGIGPLEPLIEDMRRGASKSIEYVQEHIRAPMSAVAAAAA